MNEVVLNLVRDADNTLKAYQDIPEKSAYGDYWIGYHRILLDPELFPEVTFESDIKQVTLTIKELDNGAKED